MGSPVRSGSVRSMTDTFRTDSECFTMSMSFSASPRTGSLENGSKLHAEKKKAMDFLGGSISGCWNSINKQFQVSNGGVFVSPPIVYEPMSLGSI
ncbi:hypothetical protein DY000_02032515 [Brassica cretica]|nr:hypothetical protein DY000_02032515 [Brassica cretica]